MSSFVGLEVIFGWIRKNIQPDFAVIKEIKVILLHLTFYVSLDFMFMWIPCFLTMFNFTTWTETAIRIKVNIDIISSDNDINNVIRALCCPANWVFTWVPCVFNGLSMSLANLTVQSQRIVWYWPASLLAAILHACPRQPHQSGLLPLDDMPSLFRYSVLMHYLKAHLASFPPLFPHISQSHVYWIKVQRQ